MIVLIAVVVIMVASATFFYLKSPLLTSVVMLFAAIIGVLVSFNFFELLAHQLVSRAMLIQWAHPVCLILLFVITFVLIRLAADQVVGANIDFGNLPKIIVSITCGLAVGFILAGVVVVALAMSPLSSSLPYERFAASVKADNNGQVESSTSAIADGFVSGLFNLASKGSFSSKKSFGVYHADFLDQLHLNRKGLGDGDSGVLIIAGEKTIVVPSKNNVRISGENFAVVRAGIKPGTIEKGGPSLKGSSVSFTLGQLRVLCKKKDDVGNTNGSAIAVYPSDYQLLDGPMRESDDEGASVDLNKVVTVSSKGLVSRKGGRAAWMDLYYKVPSGYQAAFLQFRNNVIVKLSKPVVETEDILQLLDE